MAGTGRRLQSETPRRNKRRVPQGHAGLAENRTLRCGYRRRGALLHRPEPYEIRANGIHQNSQSDLRLASNSDAVPLNPAKYLPVGTASGGGQTILLGMELLVLAAELLSGSPNGGAGGAANPQRN